VSGQDHYDFGMRAVNTVIQAAGNNRAAFPDMKEGLLVANPIPNPSPSPSPSPNPNPIPIPNPNPNPIPISIPIPIPTPDPEPNPEQEDLLVLSALADSNRPKFLADDMKLFNGILSDLFPGWEVPTLTLTLTPTPTLTC